MGKEEALSLLCGRGLGQMEASPVPAFWIQHSKGLDRREEGLQDPQGVVMETVSMIMNREQGKKYTTLVHCIDEALEAREGTRGT